MERKFCWHCQRGRVSKSFKHPCSSISQQSRAVLLNRVHSTPYTVCVPNH